MIELEIRAFRLEYLDQVTDPRGWLGRRLTNKARRGIEQLAEVREQPPGIPAPSDFLMTFEALEDELVTWIIDHGSAPWSEDSTEGRRFMTTELPGIPASEPQSVTDARCATCLDVIAVRKCFHRWFSIDDAIVRANALMLLLRRLRGDYAETDAFQARNSP